ncbi:MAG: helix-turn-helix domain-containing protein [Clostridia bacterium]|nr:helix-turn-helix domain-containing protein [Clostridia bacterium]MDE7336665.1 helix-turn-helix domain-containing protein [Clostridia bacterium]
MEVKDILKTLRKTSKISQSELASNLGIGQATVCQWEKGLAKPTCDGIIALSKFYNVSADFLLGINDEMHGAGLSDEYEELIGIYDNLTNTQKYLIIEIMKQMKDL